MMKLFQKQGWNLVNDSLVLDTGDQTDSRALITGLTASLEKGLTQGQQ